MIPKIIHYCWFGRGPKPEVFEKCFASWKQYMPDFQIIEWNEENTDLDSCHFLRDAYNQKKWAFVSDVVRLQAVYRMGGIYMDTDVELFQSLNDYLEYDGFFFFQNHSQINTGMGFGACAQNQLIAEMLTDYERTVFSTDRLNQLATPVLNTATIQRAIPDFLPSSQNQLCRNMLFVHYEDYYQRATHYGTFGWQTEEQKKLLKFAKKKHGAWGIKKIFRNPKIFLFLETHHLSFVSKVYSFLVYDFVDYGPVYWAAKAIYKVKNKFKK